MKKVFYIAILFTLIFSNIYAKDKVYVIKKLEFQEVNRWYSSYIKNGLEEAKKNDASLIILEIDTPGGLLSSALEIKNALIESEMNRLYKQNFEFSRNGIQYPMIVVDRRVHNKSNLRVHPLGMMLFITMCAKRMRAENNASLNETYSQGR